MNRYANEKVFQKAVKEQEKIWVKSYSLLRNIVDEFKKDKAILKELGFKEMRCSGNAIKMVADRLTTHATYIVNVSSNTTDISVTGGWQKGNNFYSITFPKYIPEGIIKWYILQTIRTIIVKEKTLNGFKLSFWQKKKFIKF